jgi:hypothetical protein
MASRRVSQKTIGTFGQQVWSSSEIAGGRGGPDDALAARSVTGAPDAEPPDLHAGGCSPGVGM